jgi:FkbM family methyltransferase
MIFKIKKKLHILHNIYVKHKYFKKRKTYAMDGEDIVIVDYFKNRQKGFYVDVGCYHPIHRNNTFLLHKKGWNGINIDIHSFSIELFKYLRPNDLNYNFAVSEKKEIINMYFQKELSQLSTIDFDQAKKTFQGPIKEKKIQSYSLDEVFKFSNLENKKIDLLDIDVEGADFKVLKGLSFEITNPELICVEIHDKNLQESETYKFLINLNYELIWSGVFSHIFRSKT